VTSSIDRADPASPSRIPYPPLDNLSPAKHARVFDPNKNLLNVSRMALHACDAVWGTQAALGRATIDADLDPRRRELAVVRVAWLQRSEYELFHHRPLALRFGVTDAELAATTGGDLDILGAADRVLIEFVDQVVRDVSPSDAAVDAMREHYDIQFLFDMVVVIGSYMLTARLAAVGGVEIEDQPVKSW
jgi:AhpD family alkylhydroperoxidase